MLSPMVSLNFQHLAMQADEILELLEIHLIEILPFHVKASIRETFDCGMGASARSVH